MKIKPLQWYEKGMDLILLPIMYLIAWISGGFKESPQWTHRWNNIRITSEDIQTSLMAFTKGIPGQMKLDHWWKRILFHIPFLGGWRHYVVVTPENPEEGWYAGWHNEFITGASRILCHEPVRLLVGSESIYFMGFDNQGNQIPVKIIDKGKIGVVGPHTSTTLL